MLTRYVFLGHSCFLPTPMMSPHPTTYLKYHSLIFFFNTAILHRLFPFPGYFISIFVRDKLIIPKCPWRNHPLSIKHMIRIPCKNLSSIPRPSVDHVNCVCCWISVIQNLQDYPLGQLEINKTLSQKQTKQYIYYIYIVFIIS